MRLVLFAAFAFLALPAAAYAQEVSIPNSFAPYEADVLPDEPARSTYIYRVPYRQQQERFERVGTGFSLPLVGSLRLDGHGDSIYLSDTEKKRNERLQVAIAVNEHVDAMVGFRRFKHRQQSMFAVRELTFGIDLRRRF